MVGLIQWSNAFYVIQKLACRGQLFEGRHNYFKMWGIIQGVGLTVKDHIFVQ